MVKPGFRFHSVLSTPGTSAGIAGVTDGGGGGLGNREMTMTMMTSLMMMIGGKLCQSRDSFDRLGQYLSLSAFTDS